MGWLKDIFGKGSSGDNSSDVINSQKQAKKSKELAEEYSNTLLGSNQTMVTSTLNTGRSEEDSTMYDRRITAVGNKARERQRQQSILGSGSASTSILGGGLY